MTSEDHPFTHIVETWLDSPDDFLDPDTVLDRVMAQVDTRHQRQARWPEWRFPLMNKFVTIGLGAAAVVAVLLVGTNLLRSSSPPPGGAPPTSPVLIARGDFVEHDWGPVEFEATRVGSSVMGHMTIFGRDDGPGPITVDLQCARETDEGIVVIGGYDTETGTPIWVAVKRGSPDRANVRTPLNESETETTCLANVDRWLEEALTRSGGRGLWEPAPVLNGGVEFGP